MIKAAVVGGSGYTGSELARILSRHPGISLAAITSRQNAGIPIAKALPFLKGFTDLAFTEALDENGDYDLVFLATPHNVSMKLAPGLLSRGIRVVDLSGDYRLGSAETYKKWYGHEHVDPENLDRAVYGLPELFREDIVNASLVANPGCYPTCSILSLAPLLSSGLAEGKVIVDAKSGTSGAGQEPSRATHHPTCGSSITPYKVGTHRHSPEVKMVLDRLSGEDVEIVFTPHLLPIVRGMLTTSYVTVSPDTSADEIAAAYRRMYDREFFVHMTPIPSIPSTVGANFCEVGFEKVGSTTVVAMGALDNLVKGAAGQAVQNANIMFKFEESLGINFPGLGV